MKLLSRFAAFLFLIVGEIDAAPIIREAGAIYLSDFGQKPLRLKVLRPAPCYFDIGMTRYAGTLRFPQTVQVEAFADNGCRIRGNAQQGGVAAWIPYSELEPLPEGLLANLKRSEERRRVVDALIARNEVAIGMTIAEVGRSLGKPQKVTIAPMSKELDKFGSTSNTLWFRKPPIFRAMGRRLSSIPARPKGPRL